jgi:short-subunit dehydrogenase
LNSSGIGKSLAIKFANNNHLVIGSARRENAASEIKKQIDNPENFKYFVNDISDPKSVNSISVKIQNEYYIDCLINNAGITSFKPFVENKESEIESIIDTNLKGPIYAIKSVLPEMINKQSGIIINILSVAAKKVFTNSSLYSATKSGLESFSKALREELREHNIKIINVYPGATSTEIWPESTIQDLSDKMMNADNLANLIFDLYSNSSYLSPEEIVVRPISGDL